MLKSTTKELICELPAVAVPTALLAVPETFGGRKIADCRVGTLVISGGRIMGLRATPEPSRMMVLPRLTETHVHLDKCHTVERCDAVGGDLLAASAAQARDQLLWTPVDLNARMRRGLRELAAAGCGAVRTHIDWDTAKPTAPLAWEVAQDLVADAKAEGVTLQVAALTSIDQMADPTAAEAVARRVAHDGGVLGSFLLDHPNRRDGLRTLFSLANEFGLALDFHVDEGLEPALDGIDLVIETAREMRHSGPVLCGHLCSLAVRSDDAVARVADGLAETGIAVATLPTTNLYLQSRGRGTPDHRGLTRVHELIARGVNVVVGTDNVRDAFCPVGTHDPRNTLGIAVLAAHLDPPFGDHFPMITTQAQKALGLTPQTIDTAQIEDLLVFDVPDTSSVLAAAPAPRPLRETLKGEPCDG